MNRLVKFAGSSAVGLAFLAFTALPTFASTGYNNYGGSSDHNYQGSYNSGCGNSSSNHNYNYMKNYLKHYKMMWMKFYDHQKKCWCDQKPIWQMGNNMYGWFDNGNMFHMSNFKTLMQSNTANISNNVSANANTGYNNASFNTRGDVSIDTGDASNDVSIDNNVNSNYASGF